MHIHAFALDVQTFLKEDVKNQSSIPGKNQTHQQSKQCWKGEMGERVPQQIAFLLKTRQARDVYVSMMYGGFFRCLGPECPG